MAVSAIFLLATLMSALNLASGFNSISLNYLDYSNMQSNFIYVTTRVTGGNVVHLNISMDTPKVDIYVDSKLCDQNAPFCQPIKRVRDIIYIQIGETFVVSLFQWSSTQLFVYYEGCYQDLTSSCRNGYSTQGDASLCICDGSNNRCTNTKPFPDPNHCSDAIVQSTPAISVLFVMTAFFGMSNKLGDIALTITRDSTKSQIKYNFAILSNSDVVINGQTCIFTTCEQYIEVGDTMIFQIGYYFEFSIHQTTYYEADVSYMGCLVEDISSCRDTPDGLGYYGCLCPGEASTCASPKKLQDQCSVEAETTTSLSTTTEEPPAFVLNGYFDINVDNPLSLRIVRTEMNSDGAAFILYPLGGTSLTINDYTCTKSECSESLLTNERMNLTFYSQKFYLLQQENGTLVGTGDHDCPQDLSTTCKYGIMNPSCPMESCLCEGDIQCIFPADFDTCPSTTDAMFTTTPMTPIIPFIITAYFGNSTYMEEAVMVTRTDMSSQEATFTIYSLRRFSIQINNIHLDNFLQFFLYQETNNTLVGVGENCIQDISTDCKSGKSIPSNAYSTCLCEGKEVCSLPANFDICDENSAITTLTTVETTESFTTETLPSAFTVSAFYGYYMANMQRVVVVQRTVFDSTGANFTIYQTSSIPVQVDGIPCDDNCTRRVDADSRMDINVNGALQFYLYEHSNGTLVGIGEDTCVQDLSEQCKSGKPDPNESIYACLCEGGRTCTSSNEFDSCNLHPEITSSTSSSTSSSLPSSTMAAVTSAEITTSQFSTSTVTNESTTATTATRITTNTTFTLPSSTSTPTTSTTSRAPTAAIPSLSDLSNSTIGQNNVTTVLNDTLIYSGSQGQLTTDQVDQIATILSKSANVIGLNQTDSLMILINMDNCLFASNAAVSDSAAMQMTSMLPTMVQNTVASSIDYLQGTNMGFSARKVNCSDYGSDQGLMDELTMFVTINGAPNANRNAIRIPLGTVCSETDISHVFFSLYRDRKLFKGPKQYRTYNNHVWQDNKPGEPIPPSGSASVRVKRESEPTVEEPPPPCLQQNSLASEAPVMSGTMLSGNGGNITSRLASAQPVAELQFNIQGLLPPLHGRFVVTWWNPETGDWATEEECETTRNGDMVVASCKHLTDFTLIVDAALNDPCVCDMGLIATGYVVNGMSIASLVFLFIVYICAFIPKFANTKAMRFVSGCATSKRDSISLSYTTSLLLFYFTFTVFSNQSVSGDACSTMASICYALFLSTIVMNIFKCIRMTVRFVPPSARDYFQFFQRALVFDTISIIVPFIISILLLLLTDFFDRNDAFCWVRVDYVVFATVIPISILILNALVATSLVAYRLFVSHLKVKKGGKHVDYNLGAKLLNLLILQFTLGMPWLLQYFTLAMPKATVWHYVFTIVLGSQGTLLVILFFHHRQRVLRSSRYAKKLASMQTQATNLSDGSSTGN